MKLQKALGLAATLIAVAVGGVAVAGPAHAGAGPSPAAAITAGGFHKLINSVTTKCIEVAGGSVSNGARIQQWDCGAASNTHRRWAGNDLGNGFVQYMNQKSGKCLNAIWGTINVDQQDCNAADQRQWWRWLGADVFGNLVLANPTPWGDSCLALQPFSFQNGVKIGIADCATTSGQLFRPVAE